MKKLSTCLWFDGKAANAAELYSSVFKDMKVGHSSQMMADFEIEGLKILGLNGGPQYKFTPSMSFFVSCANEAEIDERWKKLSEGGQVRMGLDKYPWAEKYGWTADKYGVEWQLMISPREQKIAPAILFVDKLFGKGEEAINFYLSLFPNSKIDMMAKDESTKTVLHCSFSLNGVGFVLMEGQGKHGHTPSEAFSIVVNCENQDEVDNYWEKLSSGGSTGKCGWLKDKYGISWQVVPTALGRLMSTPGKGDKVMQAMLKMTKLEIAKLEEAAK